MKLATGTLSILLTVGLLTAAIATPALAQDNSALRREIARLKTELAEARADCAAIGGPPSSTAQGKELRIADLGFSIVSLRVGPASGFERETIAVTTTIAIRNLGRSPLALNYNSFTFAMVDNKGIGYKMHNEYQTNGSATYVKGLSIATRKKANTRNILSPGQTVLVTFIPIKNLRDGQSPGDSFDLNVTFGEYLDKGDGRVVHVRDYPVGFVGVRRL